MSLVWYLSVSQLARYVWAPQASVDLGLVDGSKSAEGARLRAANKSIGASEKAPQLVKDASDSHHAQAVVAPKDFRPALAASWPVDRICSATFFRG